MTYRTNKNISIRTSNGLDYYYSSTVNGFDNFIKRQNDIYNRVLN